MRSVPSGRVRSYLDDEYGLIATGIAVVLIPAFSGVGTKMKTTFTTIQTALK
jgi:Flp pilus assembly pilin Flp